MITSKIQKNIPQGWKEGGLLDCFYIPSKIVGIKLSEYEKEGDFPVFDQGQDYISGYSSKKDLVVENIPVILFGDHTRIVKYIKSQFIVGADGTKILMAKEGFDPLFLYYLMLNQKIPNTGYNRHFKFLKEIMVLLPKLKNEQKKIAEILGAVDEDIAKTQEVIDATEKLKRGLMQQLFTRGIRHVKFKKTKIGEIPEEWEVIQMGELFGSIIGGGTPSRKEAKYWDGNIPWMTVKDMSDKKYVYDTEEYITVTGLNESSSSLIPENNLITSTRMGIGRVYINKVPVAINQDLKGLIVKDDFILDYVYWLILSVAKKLEMKGTGSTVKGIRLEDFRSLDLALTRNKQEQKKISEILSAVDEKISINKKIKEKLAFLKKGLMQDLLSGRVRTIV